MKEKSEISIDDLNFTQKSTKENEIQDLDILPLYTILEGKNERFLFNFFNNKYKDIEGIINSKNDDNISKEIIKAFNDKKENEEFDLLSSNSNLYNQKSINSLLGKKHSEESSLNNISQIFYVEKNEIKTKEKIFKINKNSKNEKPKIYRLDYYKKLFIKNFLNYLLNYGKMLIKDCPFSESKNLKLHMPNYKLYGGNPKEKDNKEFLKKSIKQVFMDYDETKNKGNSRQKNNEILINKIYGINNFPSSKEEIKLNEFFNMDIETGIKKYYESEEFQEFKEDEIIQYYDKMFYLEKNRKFSLLEDFGFIRLVNMPFYSKNPK